MSQNKTKLNGQSKITSYYAYIALVVLIAIGYILPYINYQAVEFQAFTGIMSSVLYPVNAINRFNVNIPLNQLYLSILWIGCLGFSIPFIYMLKKSKTQTKKYGSWVWICFVTGIMLTMFWFLVLLNKPAFLYLVLKNDYTRPVFSTFMVAATQIQIILFFYSAKIVVSNFVYCVLYDHDDIQSH